MTTMKIIYRQLSSMKSGLILLVLIGLVSAVGSVFYPNGFFQTIVFKLLLLSLGINMLFCTMNRFIALKSLLTKKGSIRKIGLLLLHAGIVFILIGGVLLSYFGQEAKISILTGETADLTPVFQMDQPTSIQLNEFMIETNEDGTPSQYYSDVTILHDGKVEEQQLISVNHPLKFEGIKAYQESFGYEVKTKIVAGSTYGSEQLLSEGEFLEIPGSERIVKIYRYFPNYDPAKGLNQTSMKEDHPRVIYSVYENNNLLGVGATKFGNQIEIDDGVSIIFTGVEPYTVLKVKTDPGLPIALIGSLLFMVGIGIVLLYTPLKQDRYQPLQEKQQKGKGISFT